MKKLLFSVICALSIPTFALEVGEVYKGGIPLKHLLADGTELTTEIVATSNSVQNFKTVIEFFQTGCSYCTINRPNFIALSKEFPQTALFKLVGIDKKEDALRKFYDTIKTEFNFPYVLDTQRLAAKAFGITGTPTSFILDQNGTVVYKHVGTFEPADMDEIRHILK